MFATTILPGLYLGFPDVCLTPPMAIPIPYPNLALPPLGVPAVYEILYMCTPAHNFATTIVMSLGDTPGVMLGVASGMVMGPSRNLTGAFTVLTGGLPTARMTSIGITNLTNCPNVDIVPSQIKVLLLAP